MTRASLLARAGALLAIAWAVARPASALPTMIRLGYPNCASCHISPQGGGLLNEYGRGIDEAQSLRAADYKPPEAGFGKMLSWGGRITQDVRAVTSEQFANPADRPALWNFRSRWMYRNVTSLGKGVRVSATVLAENDPLPRSSLAYDHAVRPRDLSLNTAMVHYRPKEGLEFAAGRDLLPTGVYVSDLAPFIKSRNRFGYYDTPTQVKMFWWGRRHQISPYVFGPGGNEVHGERETGGGTLAEFDVLGKQRTIVGVHLLRGNALNGNRRMAGLYARLGFGKWGVLAEHDLTYRTMKRPEAARFRQHASYLQLFWAAREWLVFSAIGERLSVEQPFGERLYAGKFEVAARLSGNFTFGLSTRMQRNLITGAWSPAVQLQLAMKTVN